MLSDVPRETRERLERFVSLLVEENERQNLVARSTLPDAWNRHVIDSVQILDHAPADGCWIDVGTGGGLPGIVVAIVRIEQPITLVEPRRKRAVFLQQCVVELGLGRVRIEQRDVRQVDADADIISARAVASLDQLLALSFHLSHRNTVWLLPKGRNAAEELEIAQTSWQGEFTMIPSQTASDSFIVKATNVERKR